MSNKVASDYTIKRIYAYLKGNDDGWGYVGTAPQIGWRLDLSRYTVIAAIHAIRNSGTADVPYSQEFGYRLFGNIANVDEQHTRNAQYQQTRSETHLITAQHSLDRRGFRLPNSVVSTPDPRHVLTAVTSVAA